MKTLNTLILLMTGILCFPQLQPFIDADFGRFEPKFLHQEHLIGNRYTQNTQTGNYDVWDGIYKVHSSGVATKFTVDGGQFLMPSYTPETNTHFDNIYVYSNNFFRKMSLGESKIYDSHIYNNQYGEPGYPLSGTFFSNAVYWLNTDYMGTYIYNLYTDEMVNLTNSNSSTDPHGPRFMSFMPRSNYMLAEGFINYQTQVKGLLKINVNHIIEDFHPIEGISSIAAISQSTDIFVNGRDIIWFYGSNGVRRLYSVNPSGLVNSNFISDNIFDAWESHNIDFIMLPDGVIFRLFDDYFKTNGSSYLEPISAMDGLNLDKLFHSASPYNRFTGIGTVGSACVPTEEVTYFGTINEDSVARIYKMTSIDNEPELIFEGENQGTLTQRVRHAVDWNGNLVFVLLDNSSSTPDLIYLYDGTDLILNPDLNTFSDRTMDENPSITGLLSIGDLLLVNTEEGVYAIDYDEVMSVKDETNVSKLAIYPNPVKDILHFSSPLKGIMVYDLSGKIVFANNESSQSINVNHLPKGTYVLTGMDEKNQKSTTKFIKN